MDSGYIYLTKEEQNFLMSWLEINDPREAAEKFARMLTSEQCDPTKLQIYVQTIIQRQKK